MAGFSAADFDVYEPKKQRSNIHNRERLEVKQKLLALGRGLAGRLRGLDGAPLEVSASVEHPALWNHKQVDAQHLFCSRSEGSRKELDKVIDRSRSMAQMIDDPTPQRTHIFLHASVTHAGLELGLRLHPDARVDRENLERKCQDTFESGQLVRLLAELPETLHFGLTSEDRVPVREVTSESIEATLAALRIARPAPLSAGPWLVVEELITREAAIALGDSVGARLCDTLEALLPIYWFTAWARENDFVSIREAIQKEKVVARQRGLAKNDKVRIVRGMFAGKTGVVQELDPKGGLRLLIGMLAVKVDATDVDKL